MKDKQEEIMKDKQLWQTNLQLEEGGCLCSYHTINSEMFTTFGIAQVSARGGLNSKNINEKLEYTVTVGKENQLLLPEELAIKLGIENVSSLRVIPEMSMLASIFKKQLVAAIVAVIFLTAVIGGYIFNIIM